MGVGFDAVDVAALPAGGDFYLEYVDGAWPTFGKVRARFPAATILTVTVTGDHPADIGDVEFEDMGSAKAASWIERGMGELLYSDISRKRELDQALNDLRWGWFAADWTGVPHLVPGSLATQWAAPGYGSPGNYDISASIDFPAPVGNSQPLVEANMIASTPSGNGYWVLLADGSVWSYGDAQYFGGCNAGAPTGLGTVAPAGGLFPPGVTALSIESHPGGEGYWILSSHHQVYAFGAAAYHGAPPA